VNPSAFHLAQINVALPKAPVDSPVLEESVAALDPINALADGTPDSSGGCRPRRAMWWVPAGQIPSVTEAAERLRHLREHGPTPYAFTFKASFALDEQLVIDEEIGCPA
jgi:Domain of unknown function (DUF3291)